VHTVDRQRLVLLKRKVLQDSEDLQDGDAAGTGRWHAIHGVATIGALERLALLSFIGRKIRRGQVPRTCRMLLDSLDYILHELSAVKYLCPLCTNQLENMCVVRVL
jgi:hypothetical protein